MPVPGTDSGLETVDSLISDTIKEISENPDEQKFIEDQLKNDPDYVESVKKTKATKVVKKEEKNPEETVDGANVDEGGNLADTEDDKGKDGDGTVTDVEGDDDTEGAFEDNIIEGLSGEEMAELPESVQIAIASTRKTLDEMKETVKKAEELKALLENDPIAKERLKRIQDGEIDNLYSVGEIPEDSVAKLKTLIATGNVGAFEKELKKVIQEQSQAAYNNRVLEESVEKKHIKAITDAGKVLLEISKLNKDLAVDIDDPFALANIKRDEKNPGIYDKYEKGLHKFVAKVTEMKEAGQITSVPEFISKMGARKLYAMFAEELGLPLVVNASKKINEAVLKNSKEILKLFKKGRDTETAAPVQGGASNVDKNKAKKIMQGGGVDKKRLAQDEAYHAEVLKMKPWDSEWIDQVSQMRLDGEKLLKTERK